MYIYYRFGRPSKPSSLEVRKQCPTKGTKVEKDIPSDGSSEDTAPIPQPDSSHNCCHSQARVEAVRSSHDTNQSGGDGSGTKCVQTSGEDVEAQSSESGNSKELPEQHAPTSDEHVKPATTTPCHMDMEAADLGQSAPAQHACQPSSRPFWATVTSGVFHCGAGCVLGDIVGEWLVYGTGATIDGRMVWPELLIDYAFALLFGIVFQYFSIAPMSGQWGPTTFWRAAKADVASLTSFEVGAFAWMIAFQVGMFGDKLDMSSWTYWWLMQVGMCLGVVTAWPANWWLLRHNIKEACC